MNMCAKIYFSVSLLRIIRGPLVGISTRVETYMYVCLSVFALANRKIEKSFIVHSICFNTVLNTDLRAISKLIPNSIKYYRYFC